MFSLLPRLVPFVITFVWIVGCALPPRSFEGPLKGGIEQNEVKVATLTERGMAAFRAGNGEEAVELFRMAFRLAPESIPVARNLGTSLLQIGAFEDAERIFSSLIERRPQDPDLLFSRANARRGQHLFRQALDDYRQALAFAEELVPSDEKGRGRAATIARTLADALFRVGLLAESRCTSERVLLFSSSRDDIRRHARLLRGMGLYILSRQVIEGRLTQAELAQEPTLLFELALAEFALNESDRFEKRKAEALSAAAGDPLLSEQFKSVFQLADETAEPDLSKGAAFLVSERLFLPDIMAERLVTLTEVPSNQPESVP